MHAVVDAHMFFCLGFSRTGPGRGTHIHKCEAARMHAGAVNSKPNDAHSTSSKPLPSRLSSQIRGGSETDSGIPKT